MSVLAHPWGLLALAAIPVIVYLHRRAAGRRHVVPLVALWVPGRRPDAAHHARRRLDLILILRVLFVIAIALGLSGPRWPATGARRHVLVLDASASMQARDAGGSRFDAAVRSATAILGGLGRDEPVAIVRAGAPATAAHALSTDRRSLERALAALRPGEARKDVAGGIAEAARLVDGAPAVVHVFSDVPEAARVLDPARRLGLDASDVLVHPVGLPAENVAVVALDAVPVRTSPLDHEVFVAVANFARAPRTVTVALHAEDGVRERRRLTVPAGAREAAVFLTGPSPWIEARLEGAADALPLDDRAVLALPHEPLSVLYASRGDRFVDAALRAHPRVRVRQVSLDRLEVEARAGSAVHVAVIDGAPIPRDLPLPALAFLTAQRGTPRGAQDAAFLDWRRDHPLFRRLDLAEVRVASPRVLAAPETETLARSAFGPLVRAWSDGGARRVEFGFAVSASNLGELPLFPVIVARTLDWLAEDRVWRPVNVNVGDPVRLAWPATSSGPATVRRPDGSTERTVPEGGAIQISSTERLGRYDVTAGDISRSFAANLLDAEESNVARPAMTPSARATADAGGGPSRDPERPWRDLTRWPFAIALQLLSVEIWLLQRRARAHRP